MITLICACCALIVCGSAAIVGIVCMGGPLWDE